MRPAAVCRPKAVQRARTVNAKAAGMSGPVKKVVLAYSGGLDTSIILKWLVDVYNCEVVTFTADLGQVRREEGLLWASRVLIARSPALIRPRCDLRATDLHAIGARWRSAGGDEPDARGRGNPTKWPQCCQQPPHADRLSRRERSSSPPAPRPRRWASSRSSLRTCVRSLCATSSSPCSGAETGVLT
jgi:hypothetical protein